MIENVMVIRILSSIGLISVVFGLLYIIVSIRDTMHKVDDLHAKFISGDD